MTNEKDFEKGDEVWVVRDGDWQGPLRQPQILHGRIVGGGSSMTIIQWDHVRSPERMNTGHAKKTYSRTRKEAIERSIARMNHNIQAAEAHAEAARAALTWLTEEGVFV